LLCAVFEPSLIGEWVPAVVVKPKPLTEPAALNLRMVSGFTLGNMCRATYSTNKASNYPVLGLIA